MTLLISGRAINEERARSGGESRSKKDLLPVVEIFGPTVQGEGAMIGVQTYFIRFGGCDYRCTKCDSLHAVLPAEVKKNAHYMTVEEVVATMDPTKCKWITLSGGNPAMHDLSELVRALKQIGFYIAVETQGTIWQDWLLWCDQVTISPKGPGMGETFEPEKFDVFVQKHYSVGYDGDWCVKVVVMQAMDMEFIKSLMDRWPKIKNRLYISLGNPWPPGQDGSLESGDLQLALLTHYRGLVDDIMKEPAMASAIILPQLHVLFWGNRQGV